MTVGAEHKALAAVAAVVDALGLTARAVVHAAHLRLVVGAVAVAVDGDVALGTARALVPPPAVEALDAVVNVAAARAHR